MKKAKLTALIFVHFVVALLAFASCRQNVEYIELYQTRYIVMEFTGSHGPGDILLSNGDWVLARDINNLTKERLDATPAVGILAFEKVSEDKSVPNTPVVIGLEIKRGVKFSASDN
ncbi:MAG: hypothetical protein IKI31_06110, partial [Treponema sp.]|nr:hypothetical protein [Treponema sp.]